MPTIQRLKLHDGQRAIVNSRARHRVASCGRRFGKTMLAGYWLTMRGERKAWGLDAEAAKADVTVRWEGTE